MDIVDTTEAARRLGVQPNTVHQWRKRHPDFPAPYKQLAVGPIWLWEHIARWAENR